MSPFNPTLQPGVVVAGYRVEGQLGRGGMGVVYRAVHERLGRAAALKVLSPELAQDEEYRVRFIRESQLAASLEHPNVLPVYDAGEEEELLYLAMRYVDGSDLGEVLKQEGSLSPQRTLELVEQVASALDAAHHAGLVHRDVKPANILIERTGRVFLSDFGVAKRTGATQLTRTGSFLGSVDYCSPEQIEGKPLDGRADVYALGCVVYQCLTGQPPYRRETEVAVIHAHLAEPAPAVTTVRPDLPPSLDGVVVTAMAKHTEVRFQTAGAIADALRAALDSAPVAEPERPPAPTVAAPTQPARHETVATPPVVPPKRRRGLWLAAAAVAVAAAGGTIAALAFTGGRGETAAPTSAPETTNGFATGVSGTIEPLVPLQRSVNDKIRTLRGTESEIARLRQAAEALDRALLRAQGRAGALEPDTAADRATARALATALRRHSEYAAAVDLLPVASELTKSQAQLVVDRAGAAEAAYSTLASREPSLPPMPLERAAHVRLLDLVPATPVRQTLVLAPFLVGPRPDDPLGQGRCFGPYGTASLKLNGIRRHDSFLSCGDYAPPRGDPERANGDLHFRRAPFPANSVLTRFTAALGVDEDSASAQAGSRVTWTLDYYGERICSETTTWSGGTSAPVRMSCPLPADKPADTSQLTISQRVSLVSTEQFWAGLQDATVIAARS